MSEDSAEDISDEPQTYAITALGAGRPAKGQFSGDRGLFVRMQLRFLLRALFSAGLYHFWAKTKTRRYLWHHAEIAGERLEYVGTAKEPFVGFLIAVCLAIPIYGIFATAETLRATRPDVAGLLFVAGGVAALLFIQGVFFRTWRYRLTRTAWRGMPLTFDGSTVAFVALSFYYLLLSVATLGLAVPWMRAALARYRINNTRYADRYFQCDVTGGSLVLPWLTVYLTLGGGLIWYMVREFNTVVSRTRFGSCTFSVHLQARPFYGWFCLTLALLFGGGLAVFLFSTGGINILDRTGLVSPGLLTRIYFGTWAVGGLLLVLASAVMLVSFFQFEVAMQAFNSLEIRDTSAFRNGTARPDGAPDDGETLAETRTALAL